jgi:hypothetical protein
MRRIAAAFGWVITLVPSGWQFFKWLLGWGEHIEFVAHRTHDIKYVGPMLEFILDPPHWLALSLVPPGLALVYWGNRPAPVADFDFSKLTEAKEEPSQTRQEVEDIMSAADIEPHQILEAMSPPKSVALKSQSSANTKTDAGLMKAPVS